MGKSNFPPLCAVRKTSEYCFYHLFLPLAEFLDRYTKFLSMNFDLDHALALCYWCEDICW